MEKRTTRNRTDEQKARWAAYMRKWRLDNPDRVKEYRRRSDLKRAYQLIAELEQQTEEGESIGK